MPKKHYNGLIDQSIINLKLKRRFVSHPAVGLLVLSTRLAQVDVEQPLHGGQYELSLSAGLAGLRQQVIHDGQPLHNQLGHVLQISHTKRLELFLFMQ